MSEGGSTQNEPQSEGTVVFHYEGLVFTWDVASERDHFGKHGLTFEDLVPAFSAVPCPKDSATHPANQHVIAEIALKPDRASRLEARLARNELREHERDEIKHLHNEGRWPDLVPVYVYYKQEPGTNVVQIIGGRLATTVQRQELESREEYLGKAERDLQDHLRQQREERDARAAKREHDLEMKRLRLQHDDRDDR